MILWRHQWVPKVAAQRKIRHPPPRLLLSNSTSPLIIQSSTSRASTQTIYGNFVISVARRSFYLSLYAVLCGINTRVGGPDRETYPNKGITQWSSKVLSCVFVCTLRVGCALLSLTCNMNWCCTTVTEAPVGLELPWATCLPCMYACMCEFSVWTVWWNKHHAHFCLLRSRGSVVIHKRHPCMPWGTKLAYNGFSWK